MSWSASVVTSATTDTEPTLVLTFDQAKYIFNVAENSNRAFTQKKAHRKKTRALFLTQVGLQRTGGLAGMLMSSADQMLSTLDVVGPPGLAHSMASMRSYIYRDSMRISVSEASLTSDLTSSPFSIYKDKNVTVYSIPVLAHTEQPDIPCVKAHNVKSDQVAPVITDERIEPGSLKRKREPSPFQKRSLLKELMNSDGFSADKLEGELAQDWRKLMKKARKMTVNPQEPRIPEYANNVDMYNRPKIPYDYHHQLPRYRRSWPAAAVPTLAYVVVGPTVRGKFDVDKSLALGVPKHMRSHLTRGQNITVTVQEGDETVQKIVRPEDCIGPSEIPVVVIILDIPTPSHIPSLVSSFEQSPFYAKLRSTRPEDLAEIVVRSVFHLCGQGVLEDVRYIKFMNGFPPSAHHIISSREYNRDPVTFTTAAFNQLRLHQLDAEMFPVPKFCLEPKKELSTIASLPTNSCVMEPSLHMNIRPPGPPEHGRLPAERRDYFHPAISSPDLLLLSPSVLQKFAEMKTKVQEHILNDTFPKSKGADVGVIPLGTASAVPTSSRNVSATLIRIPSRGSVLLDAGEGTWGQLARHFGVHDSSPNVWDVLRDLRCIFVSHIHGDHHTGVAKILAKRRQLDPPPSQPLYLVSIHKLHLYLRELSDIEDLGLDDPSGNGVITVISDALHIKRSGEYLNQGMWRIEGAEPWTDYERSSAAGMRLCVALGLQSFHTIDVFHQVKCYGVAMRHQDGWSIVFSGDTLPTQTLVRGGWGATLLIHEATMGDDEEAMAQAKAHSTVGQAIESGRKCKNILLTHFSARYPRMPPPVGMAGPKTASDGQRKDPVVALAFDHANLTIGSMWRLSMYLPAIQQTFADTSEEEDEEESKAAMAVVQ
ncbi:hypothetical protein B0H10DRAFT_2076138 [Mycena sp. CBHHK59/15]|nr:hypothetical protein B0H10DRAFT_2076138 [Mycena sp. CBHHK59/15]